MLTLPDWTLFYWAIGKKEIPADSEWKNSKVLGRLPLCSLCKTARINIRCLLLSSAAALSKHAANDGKSLRRMPDIQSYGVQGVKEQ